MDTEIVLHVKPDGDDTLDGLTPERSGNSGPLATIKAARDLLRKIRAEEGNAEKPAVVRLRGGKYFLNEDLQLLKADGGTQAAPVRYEGYPGEKPVLSGGIRLSGWQECGGGVYKVVDPRLKGAGILSRQLFCNGERQPRARFPKLGGEHPWLFVDKPVPERELGAFQYKDGDIPSNISLRGAEIVMYPHAEWNNNISPLAGFDRIGRVIRMKVPGKDFDIKLWYWPTEIVPGNRYCFENVIEALSESGEWFLDGEEGSVRFLPPDGVDPNKAEIVIPVLETLLTVRFADWITVAGITFTETADGDNTNRHGLEGIGAFFAMPGMKYGGEAILIRDSRNITVDRCRIDQPGCNGVCILGSNFRCNLTRSVIDRAGANGVVVAGAHLFDPNCGFYKGRYHGHGVDPGHPIMCEITDNHINEPGRINKYTLAILTGVSDNILIAHNLMENTPGMALCLGTNGYGRNIVEYNRIRFTGRESNDSGAIHFWMEDELDPVHTGHVIRYNYISDVGSISVQRSETLPYHVAFGIYIDNFASGNFVYGNIIARIEGIAISIHSGKNNVIENNIIYDCTVDPLNPEKRNGALNIGLGIDNVPGRCTGNRFCRNIVFQNIRYMITAHNYIGTMLASCDENLYWTRDGQEPLFRVHNAGEPGSVSHPPAGWQKRGYDLHSAVGDPLFRDADRDDFSFAPDSPARKLGIAEIDAKSIGIRPEAN